MEEVHDKPVFDQMSYRTRSTIACTASLAVSPLLTKPSMLSGMHHAGTFGVKHGQAVLDAGFDLC